MDLLTKLALNEILRIARDHSQRLATLESKLQALTMIVGCVTAEVAITTPDAESKVADIAVRVHGMIQGLAEIAPQEAEVWRHMSAGVEVVVRAAEGVVRPYATVPISSRSA